MWPASGSLIPGKFCALLLKGRWGNAGGREVQRVLGGGEEVLASCAPTTNPVRISTTSNLLNLSAYIELMLLSYSFTFFLPLHLNYKLLDDSNSMI